MNADSILDTVKRLLGLESDYNAFDVDIIIGINSALMTLSQLGVGPSTGYSIINSANTWADYLGSRSDVEAVKMFIYLKTRLGFDPPANAFVVTAIEKQLEELTWRINVQVDTEAPNAVPVEY